MTTTDSSKSRLDISINLIKLDLSIRYTDDRNRKDTCSPPHFIGRCQILGESQRLVYTLTDLS